MTKTGNYEDKNYAKDYYQKNRDKRLEYTRKRDKENPNYIKNAKLKNRYGISLEKYEQIAETQMWRCCICRKQCKLFVDHCHKTNKVRGLLCPQCNLLLGAAHDDVMILENAIKYLTI